MKLPNMMVRGFVFSLVLLSSASVAVADVVSWTNWTSGSDGGVAGSLTAGSTPVGVTFTGPYMDALISGGGTDYWTPSAPYVSAAVDNAPNATNPPGTDIIRLNTGGVATITFSESVHDPLLALVSWNGNVVDFNTPIEIVSYGHGYWGSGTPILNAAGDGFTGSGEVHGVIRLPGDFTSFSFSHISEGWHGFTVGVLGLAGPPEPPVGVPEPATLFLLGTGLVGLGGFVWRHRRG